MFLIPDTGAKKPMNFQRLIKSLIKHGWTQNEIAKEIGCSQPNVARLLKDRDTEPRYSVGVNLVELEGKVSV